MGAQNSIYSIARELSPSIIENIIWRSSTIGEKNIKNVLNAEVRPEMARIFQNPDWQEEVASQSEEKIATLLMASADIDPDTAHGFYWKSRKHHLKRNHLTIEHLEILSRPENIQAITSKNMLDLIHLACVGRIDPAGLELHIEKNGNLLNNDNSKYYRIVHKYDLTLDEPTIEFIEYKIPFVYLEDYRNLREDFKVEFWNWMNLGGKVKNFTPARDFFNMYFKLEELGLSFSSLEDYRKNIEKNQSSIFRDENFELEYDYWFELENIENEIEEYRPLAFKSREKTNMHHIFFPEDKYHASQALIRFRNKKENQVKILENAHNQLNREFAKLRAKYGYEIPVISESLIILIDANRQKFPTHYMNFLELKRVVCQICIDALEVFSRKELYRNEMFLNAVEIYKFLKLSSKFITDKTTKMY